MANVDTKPVKADGTGYTIVAGSFAPNGSSAVSAASNVGVGWSVARTAAGTFTITFTDRYNRLVSFTPVAQLATAADIVAQGGTYTASAKTMVVRLNAGATPTDVAADANNRVNFTCIFQNTSITT